VKLSEEIYYLLYEWEPNKNKYILVNNDKYILNELQDFFNYVKIVYEEYFEYD